jgi:hypothetical protein
LLKSEKETCLKDCVVRVKRGWVMNHVSCVAVLLVGRRKEGKRSGEGKEGDALACTTGGGCVVQISRKKRPERFGVHKRICLFHNLILLFFLLRARKFNQKTRWRRC